MLLDLGSWRWVFLVNLPVVAVVVFLTLRHVPESRGTAPRGRLDVAGTVLAATALGAVAYGLGAWAEQDGDAARVPLVVALVAAVLLVVRERTAEDPLLPPELLRTRRLLVANGATLLVYAALGGLFFWLVVALQVVGGWTPLAAGLALLPVTVIMLLFSPRAGALGDRVGPRLPMTLGPLLAAAGTALLARVGTSPDPLLDVLLPVALVGAGLTLTVTPLTTTALSAVDEARTGLAGGLNNAVARTGGLLAVAALPVLTGLGADGFADPVALEPAFRTAMLVCAGLLVAGAAVSAVGLRPPRPGSPGGPPTGSPTGSPTAAPSGATCPRRHCAVDATPIAAQDRGAQDRVAQDRG